MKAAHLIGLPCLCTSLLAQVAPHFSVRDAIQAEWERRVPHLTEKEKTLLPKADQDRLEMSIKRIGAPGTPNLLPPELDKPTEELWLRKAAEAKKAQERFTALTFLNRLKSAKALVALEGLSPEDARTWPRHLHLEASIASARLNGAVVSKSLDVFLLALQKFGKVDPVRAQAARLRLVMAGKEKDLLTPVKATPGSVLALLDAWNRAPWENRKEAHLSLSEHFDHFGSYALWGSMGFAGNPPASLKTWFDGESQEPRKEQRLPCLNAMADRYLAGLPQEAPKETVTPLLWIAERTDILPGIRAEALRYLSTCEGEIQLPDKLDTPSMLAAQLPFLKKHEAALSETIRTRLLVGTDPIARAAAIDDMTEAPKDLEELLTALWSTEEYDGVQVLMQALDKWKLSESQHKKILRRFYEHPSWTARLDAFRELAKLDPKAPWPKAPEPSSTDNAILALAKDLADAAQPVRLRVSFQGDRNITLRLDPVNAPMNVANMVLLARKGFFDGHFVPRVVPDFVVQMGSPADTMEGGPGYTVRCEDSLTWFGPGSVGMALSGKDTGGSQFFITTNATPHLTGRYTRLGEVEDPDWAMQVLDELELGAKIEKVEVLSPENAKR